MQRTRELIEEINKQLWKHYTDTGERCMLNERIAQLAQVAFAEGFNEHKRLVDKEVKK